MASSESVKPISPVSFPEMNRRPQRQQPPAGPRWNKNLDNFNFAPGWEPDTSALPDLTKDVHPALLNDSRPHLPKVNIKKPVAPQNGARLPPGFEKANGHTKPVLPPPPVQETPIAWGGSWGLPDERQRVNVAPPKPVTQAPVNDGWAPNVPENCKFVPLEDISPASSPGFAWSEKDVPGPKRLMPRDQQLAPVPKLAMKVDNDGLDAWCPEIKSPTAQEPLKQSVKAPLAVTFNARSEMIEIRVPKQRGQPLFSVNVPLPNTEMQIPVVFYEYDDPSVIARMFAYIHPKVKEEDADWVESFTGFMEAQRQNILARRH